MGCEVPQEGKAKGKDQREEGRTRKERKVTQRGECGEGGRVRTRDADPAWGGFAHAGTGRWMAGLGELRLRARLLSAVRSAAFSRCLNIH